MSLDLEMEEIHKIFFEESFEGLDVMESGLLNLDANADRETIDTIFRAAHSIKGGAATFGFMEVSEFTHGVETLLDEMRNGRRAVTADAVHGLLQAVDGLRATVKAVQAKAPIDVARNAALAAEIAALLARPASGPAPAAAAAPPAPAGAATNDAAPFGGGAGWIIDFRPSPALLRGGSDPLRLFAELGQLGPLRVMADASAVPGLAELEPDACYLAWRLELAGAHARSAVEEIFGWVDPDSSITYRFEAGAAAEAADGVAQPGGAADAVASAGEELAAARVPAEPVAEAAAAPAVAKQPGEAGSIRVSTNKVDHLLNLVGELVITQSMLSRFADGCAATELERLRAGLTQLTRNTRELQESVMQIRMLPISFAFNRFPRLIHDMSRKLGKKVELKLSGEGTELDKTVLEKIGDPLVHLVRNALDHGLEAPAARLAAGKPETGLIELAAFHEGGNIIIEVRDDGGGLDRARILRRARERGLVAADAALSDEQIDQLIFAAGFSTAEVITDVSGRGVGMDVVRRNIEDLGGQVQIQSVHGRGSTIRIRLPLTLAILDGQLVRVGAETYVVPLLAIVETIQAHRDRLLATPGGAELFRLRDDYIPVVRVGSLFGVEPDGTTIEDGLLVVVEVEGRRFGLVVDDLLAQQQVVIKSLEANFGGVRGVAGATILGDGAVALILDVPGVVQVYSAAHAARRTLAA